MQKAPSVHMHEYSHACVFTCECGKGVIQKVHLLAQEYRKLTHNQALHRMHSYCEQYCHMYARSANLVTLMQEAKVTVP